MISASMATAKRMLRRLLGDEAVGTIDYLRFRDLGAECRRPLNGQRSRQALFGALIDRVAPLAIVETGTYLGATTEFMATFGLPVFTIESNPRNFGFARARLWRRGNVTLVRGDSRTGLCSLFDGPLRDMADGRLFFYLDAHWNEDLPLSDELEIVFGRCKNAVVMVDDFQVPHDPGYGYDNYGSGRALTPDYIAPAISANELCTFYPATPSAQEGGARRGCVILARNEVHGAKLASLLLLRAA